LVQLFFNEVIARSENILPLKNNEPPWKPIAECNWYRQTKPLQMISEYLSDAGCACLLMDIHDLSGIAAVRR
jgi:hypothetical protein